MQLIHFFVDHSQFIKNTSPFQMNKVEAGGATVFPYVGARLLPSEVRHAIYKYKTRCSHIFNSNRSGNMLVASSNFVRFSLKTSTNMSTVNNSNSKNH
jgi:hypothetical protein